MSAAASGGSRRGAPLALAWGAAVLVAAGSRPAEAAIPATGVTVVAHCGDTDGTVSIGSDPALHGSVVVTGGALRAAAPAGGRGDALVEFDCTGGAPLAIAVPRDAGFRVMLDGQGAVEWRLGDLAGPVVAHLAGSGSLQAGTLESGFTIDAESDNDIAIGRVAGLASFTNRGSGDLAIGEIDSPSFTVDLAGSGDVAVKRGHVDALVVRTRGSGDVSIDAAVGRADLATEGSGDVRVADVSGTVTRLQHGSGDISVGGAGGDGAGGARATIGKDVDDDIRRALPPTGIGSIAAAPGRGSERSGGGDGLLVAGLLALLAAATAGAAWVRRRRRLGHVADRAGPGAPRHAGVAELGAQLGRLGERASRIEALVTSREFELHRGFRELGD